MRRGQYISKTFQLTPAQVGRIEALAREQSTQIQSVNPSARGVSESAVLRQLLDRLLGTNEVPSEPRADESRRGHHGDATQHSLRPADA